MRLLLDTHVFLWWIVDDLRISPAARAAIADPANELLFSAASSWEIAIKWSLGKLPLPEPPAVYVPKMVAQSTATVLPIGLDHSLRVAQLPALHNDPFDRLLIAQAQALQATVATGDAQIQRYPVATLW